MLYDYDPAFQIFYEEVIEKAPQRDACCRIRRSSCMASRCLGLEAAAASLIAR